MNCPKVSVLLPAYNHVDYIEECVNSVLNQTYRDFEFIVGDDASTDGTAEKLLQYGEQIDELHLFDENTGGTGGFLFERARGEYIAVTNSDDAWELNKLEKQIRALKEHPDAVACFTWCERIDEYGNPIEGYNLFNVKNRTKEEWFNYFYFHGNCWAYSSILIKKDVFCKYMRRNIGMFRQVPDFYMWVQLVLEHEVVVLEEKLTKMRVVNQKNRVNVSASSRENLLRHFNEESYIWYKIFSEMDGEFFKKAFSDQLINPAAHGDIEIMCEKFFILLRAKVEYCKIAAFYYYYDHHDEMKDMLNSVYEFTRKDMYSLLVNAGPATYIR